jgi:hypothetical protein
LRNASPVAFSPSKPGAMSVEGEWRYDARMRVVCLLCTAALLAFVSATSCGPYITQACDQLTSEAEVAIAYDQSEAGTDLSCTTTADCTVVATSSACLPSCSLVLTQAGAARVQAGIAQINGNICPHFVSDGCPPKPAPVCTPLVPACVNGACAGLTPGEEAGAIESDAAGE